VSNRSTSMDLNGAALMGSAAASVRVIALATILTVKLITPDLMGAERT
jgi:hypothetical protein